MNINVSAILVLLESLVAIRLAAQTIAISKDHARVVHVFVILGSLDMTALPPFVQTNAPTMEHVVQMESVHVNQNGEVMIVEC